MTAPDKNRLAARAVAIHGPLHPADCREVLDMLGLLDDTGRAIRPHVDDGMSNEQLMAHLNRLATPVQKGHVDHALAADVKVRPPGESVPAGLREFCPSHSCSPCQICA